MQLVLETAPYILLKFALENPDRLCGFEMNADVFADAIGSGELAGTYRPAQGFIRQTLTVTAPGGEWVKWWASLPDAKKTFKSTVCLIRVK